MKFSFWGLILSGLQLTTLTAQVYVDPTATGSNNGTSWSNAYTNLVEAIVLAGANAELHIAEGIYYPDEFTGGIDNDENEHFQIFDKQTLIGGFPSGGSTLTERRPDIYKTILSGDLEQNDVPGSLVGTNALAVIKNRANASDIELDGLIIQGGVTGIVFDGDAHNVILRGCVIRGNGPAESDTDPAGSPYGGYLLEGNSATLINCVISGNVGRIAGGGFLGGGTFPLGGPFAGSYLNCTFHGNRGGTNSCDASVVESTKGCLVWNLQPAKPSGLSNTSNNLFRNAGGSDPLFWQEVDWQRAPTTEGNLRLGYQSAAIDGAPLDPLHNGKDAGNGGRVFGSSPDIGAYEWRGVRYVDASATGFETGVTWANAYTDLQDALGVGAVGRSILVAEGTYYPDQGTQNQALSFEVDQVQLLGGFPTGGGTLASRKLSGTSILSGDFDNDDDPGEPKSNNSYQVVKLAENSFSSIDGFTIERGNTELLSDKPHGAGIYSLENHHLVLKNGIIQKNASELGGALWMENGVLEVENVAGKLNQATDNGGAFYLSECSAYLDSVDFNDNESLLNGAGLYANDCLTAMWDCSLADNTSQRSGGGFYGLNGRMTAEDLTVWGNTADRNAGGLALVGTDLDGLALDVRGNSAPMDGGGIWMRSSAVSVESSLITGNSCGDDGAGIYDLETSPTFINLTLHGNNASGDGGGLYSRDSSPNFKNCLIVGNAASGSTTSASASFSNPGTSFPTYAYCYLDNFDLSSVGTANYDSSDSVLTVSLVSPLNPANAPSTGGDARQHHPSVAINGGSLSHLTSDRDVAGNSRSNQKTSFLEGYDDVVDIGAYETRITNNIAAAPPYGLAVGRNVSNLSSTVTLQPNADLMSEFALRRTISGWPKPSPSTEPPFSLGWTINGTTAPVLALSGNNTVEGVTIAGPAANAPPSDLSTFVGAVQALNTNPVSLINCTIEGGIRLEGVEAEVREINFADSFEPAYFKDNPTLSLVNSRIEKGQFYLKGVTSARVEGCLGFLPNSGFGTSFDLQTYFVNDASTTELVNCSFYYVTFGLPDPRLTNRNGGSLSVTNCFFWQKFENSSGTGPPLLSEGGATEIFSHTLFYGLDLTTQGTGNLDGSDTSLELSFLNVGGPPVFTSSSPVVNAGLSSAVQEDRALGGQRRISGDSVDIGAYEHRFVHIDPTATGANDGTTWADAYTSQSLLDFSADERVQSTLLFAEGRYRGFSGSFQISAFSSETHQNALELQNSSLLGGFPPGGGTLASRDPSVFPVIITGELDPADDNDFSYGDNISLLVGMTGRCTVDGFTFTGARNHALRCGSPLSATSFDTLVVENCRFIKNRFTNSSALFIDGGPAIYAVAGPRDAALTVRSCEFIGNESIQTNTTKPPLGGAICVNQESFNSLNDQYFYSLEVEDCRFVDNSAYRDAPSQGGWGGAVALRTGSEAGLNNFRAAFRRCHFQGNQAGDQGGAVYSGNGFGLLFESCSFSGNYSNKEAGAIYSPSRFTIGDPPTLSPSGNSRTLVNCSFQGNQALNRISAVSGAFRIINSVAWDNRVINPTSNNFQPEQDVAIASNDFNENLNTYTNCLVQGVDLTLQGNGNLDGTDPTNDPRFYAPVVLAEDGVAAGLLHPTSTVLLNKGTTAFSLSNLSTPLDGSLDLIGNARVQGSHIDIGAYEGTRAPFPSGAEQVLWESDNDGDGASYGAELAWGTDPNVADSDGANFFSAEPDVNSNGFLLAGEVSFGIDLNNSPPHTIWVASQTEDLKDWEPFFISDGSSILLKSGTVTLNGSGIGDTIPGNGVLGMRPRILLSDEGGGVSQAPKVFYRFEALRLPPESFPVECVAP